LITGFVDEEQPHLSDSIDTAKRLLISAIRKANTDFYGTGKGHSSLEAFYTVGGRFVAHTESTGLNWWEKLRSWSRWTSSVPKEQLQNSDIALMDSSNLKVQKVFRKALRKSITGPTGAKTQKSDNEGQTAPSTYKPGNTAHWKAIEHKVSAIFGTILRSRLRNDGSLSTPWDSSALAILSTAVPNISRFLQKTTIHQSGAKRAPSPSKRSIVLKFVPNSPNLETPGAVQTTPSLISQV
jgi:hypothetical protein